jgi:hypothetical protein
VDRLRPFTIAFALALCLISGSKPRIPGDGGEYVAMALNFAAFHPPALSVRDMRNIQRIVGQWDPSLAGWNMRESCVRGPDGRWDFFHFWFYSLLVVPPIWVTEAIGVTPVAAFTVLNLSLLGLALWVAQPRLGAATCLLLFAGPIIWWMDKPHTSSPIGRSSTTGDFWQERLAGSRWRRSSLSIRTSGTDLCHC